MSENLKTVEADNLARIAELFEARSRAIMPSLLAQVLRSEFRFVAGNSAGQTDASGNADILLYVVPASEIAGLVSIAVDEQGVTPGVPDTNSSLSLSITENNRLVACSPSAPTTDAQIPTVFSFGFPVPIYGPSEVRLSIKSAAADRQIFVRYSLILRKTER